MLLKGVLFERRFWSRVALHESFVLELSRYVVLNPVRAGWVRSPEAPGRVEHVEASVSAATGEFGGFQVSY